LRTSGAKGISQIMNCGESTFPSAMNATTAAAENCTSSSRLRSRRANANQIASSTATCNTLCTAPTMSAAVPPTFWEPSLETIVTPVPKTWWAATMSAAPMLSTCNGRVDCCAMVRQTPCGATTTNGKRMATATAAATPRQINASRLPRALQTYATASGTSTPGQTFTAIPAPSRP
jgi:hypothetical protein